VDLKQFLDLYKTTGNKIHAWTITRVKTEEETETGSHTSRIHYFRIRGLYGLKDEDETELTFQSLIESICAAFRSNYGLGGQAADNSPVHVDLVETRMFGNVLCHYAELSLTAEEILAWS